MDFEWGCGLHVEESGYAWDVETSLELIITTEYVAIIGAPTTLLYFNNEKGF